MVIEYDKGSKAMNNEITKLTLQFRNAIEAALYNGHFDNDFSFHKFPRGCCGDTCDLLAQYLLEHGIRTFYVCGTYGDSFYEKGTHAWLETDNKIIIDITGDQFVLNPNLLNNDIAVYVGGKSKFYSLFHVEERDIHQTCGIDNLGHFCQPRLRNLYSIIQRYL
jgi:hypothetical protein